jgi:hypothetical protein
MLELRIINAGQALPLFDLPTVMGRNHAAREIGNTIDGLIAFLDDLGGDSDLEERGDDELTGDEADLAWPEWQTRGRHKLTAIGAEGSTHSLAGWQLTDDDEDGDQDEADDDTEPNGDEKDTNNAEDEALVGGLYLGSGPGCVISDSDRGYD